MAKLHHFLSAMYCTVGPISITDL